MNGTVRVRELGELMAYLKRQRAQREYKTKAWSHNSEYPIMFSLVHIYQVDTVIECGTCGGASGAVWSLALCKLGKGKVDTWDVRNKKKIFDEVSCGHLVEYHNESFFENAGPTIAASNGKRLFFLDGLHDYDSVYNDTSLVLKHARAGDVLVSHDAVKEPEVIPATTAALEDSDCLAQRRYTILSNCGFEVIELGGQL